MASLKDLAIQAALKNDWQEACNINRQLLEENSLDLDSLNRLAFALLKIGEFEKARSTYNKVIELDKTNPIANKNIKKLETLSKQKPSESKATTQYIVREDQYIEEAGKTKTVELINLADKKILSYIQTGDSVTILPKRSKIFIQTDTHEYIGMLPDSVGMRLTSLIKGGNEYNAYVKAITDKTVIIFIREVKRASKFKNQPSFSII